MDDLKEIEVKMVEVVQDVQKVGDTHTQQSHLIYYGGLISLVQTVNSIYETKCIYQSKNEVNQEFALFDQMIDNYLVAQVVDADNKGICHCLFCIISLQYLLKLVERENSFNLHDHQC